MSSVQASAVLTWVEELLKNPHVMRAFYYFDTHLADFTEEQIKITSIAAPPFHETKRAEYFRTKFADLGLENPHIDAEGNCIALRRGGSLNPLLVVSAHLDTVFPPSTDVSVTRKGGKLFGPGISDDSCGLVAVLAVAAALHESRIQTNGSILFVGTVGEEGEGNLRGIRHLLNDEDWAGRVDAFLSFDGAETDRITNGALGSRRYRVTFRGSGGHSWGDFGTVNPVHAIGRAITKLASYPAPKEPRTTFNVGRVEGGRSVNAIPEEALMDVDLRSANADELLKLDAFFRRAMREAADDENAVRADGTRPLELKVDMLGERPSGETPANHSLVQSAKVASKALGLTATLNVSSTDSNIPISLGIPAITLGGGGTSGNAHTLDEWYAPSGRELGLKRGLLVILSTVGLAIE